MCGTFFEFRENMDCMVIDTSKRFSDTSGVISPCLEEKEIRVGLEWGFNENGG
jgi:hypothetical protein